MAVGITWASAGPLLPLMIQEFALSRSAAGWYAAIAPLGIAVVSLPVSLLVSRVGLKKIFAIGAFFMAAGVFAWFTSGYLPLLLFRTCFAIGTAIVVPVATAITAEWFRNRELPLVNGIGMSFVNLGNGLAFAATVPLANLLSFRAPIVIYASFALLGAAAWLILGRDKEKPPEIDGTKFPQVLQKRPDLTFKQVLTNRAAILMTVTVTVSWALGNAIGSWLPDYYFSVFDMPLEKASSIMSYAPIGGTASCIIGGILSTRTGRRKPFLIFSGLFTALSALFAVLFNNPVVIYTSVICFGISGGICVSALFTIPMEIPGMSIRTGVMVIAMMQVGGNLGNFISPLVVGALVDATGSYMPGFLAFIILSLGMVASGILLPETGPKGSRPAA